MYCVLSLSRVWLIATLWAVVHQVPRSLGFSRQEDRSGWPCPPPGDLPSPGIEPRSPALQAILYHLSHQGSPRILEWIAYPFSRGSFRPRNRKQVRDADKYPASYRTVPHNKELSSPCIAGRFFPSWATREAHQHVHTAVFKMDNL